jgi:hypothetical protein
MGRGMSFVSQDANDPAGAGAPRATLPVPFLRRQIGAGDAVRAFTEQLGIEPCSPCEERRKRFNQALAFRPWGQR